MLASGCVKGRNHELVVDPCSCVRTVFVIVLADGLTAKLLLVLASIVILGSVPHGIHEHVLLSDGSGRLLYFSWYTIAYIPHNTVVSPNKRIINLVLRCNIF
jgi:hypothetical protein